MKGIVLCASCALIFILCFVPSSIAQGDASGYQVQPEPTYMVIAPLKIYPAEVVQVSITIFKLYFSSITIRCSVRSGGDEYARLLETFTVPSHRLSQMMIRDTAPPGNYTMKVEGILPDGGVLFENETRIMYSQKRISVFVLLSKPMYYQTQTVQFRIIPVLPNLLPSNGALQVFVDDASGVPVRWWQLVQTNAGGFIELEVPLSDQVKYGTWQVRVLAYGYTYTKKFEVVEYFANYMRVNISAPSYIWNSSIGLSGEIDGNQTTGFPMRASGSLTLEIQDPPGRRLNNVTYHWPTIVRQIPYFGGRQGFFFSMSEIRQLNGGKDVVGKELRVTVQLNEWFGPPSVGGTGQRGMPHRRRFLALGNLADAVTVVYGDKITMKVLGDRSRTFKPGFPVSIYYAVYHEDGSPLSLDRRQVTITTSIVATIGGVRPPQGPPIVMMVRDDGIVHYEFVPDEDARMISVRAMYETQDLGLQQLEVVFYRFFNLYGNFLAVSTITESPTVDSFMIFTVRSNKVLDQVYYLVVAAGNIIISSILEMGVDQKTFSVGLTRDMVPSARIFVYAIMSSEIICDSLNFFVNGTRQNPVHARVNMGKDFSRDTIELNIFSDPFSYVAVSLLDYDWWSTGGDTFLTEIQMIQELETFNNHANMSFSHVWRYQQYIYEQVNFPSPSYAIDANTSFSFAGLLVFSDANATRLNYVCNETLGQLPCHDGTCYDDTFRCDYVWNCRDGADEMGCPENFSEPFTQPLERKSRVGRELEITNPGWAAHFVKPDGRLDLRVTLPKDPLCWMVGIFAVSQELGLGVLAPPMRHQATRPFYMRIEGPDTVIRGEQIGLRVSLFNYWHFDLECLVTLDDNDQYRFVMVEERGVVASYNPRTARGTVQTMVFVKRGISEMIYFPVLPLISTLGANMTLTITIHADSYMGRNSDSVTMKVLWDGVTNYYHTPFYLDLVNRAKTLIPDLHVNVSERALEPGKPEQLFVPGSGASQLLVTGDVVGPNFFTDTLNGQILTRRAFGSGDGAIYTVAYIVWNLYFLKETNQLSQDKRTIGLNNLNLAFQRALSYYDPSDGSFSNFRDYQVHTPSTWLSAIALETFSQADMGEFLLDFFMPSDLLNHIALFLCSTQNQNTGIFRDQAAFYDYKMLEPDGSDKNISLTAHVLIAMASSMNKLSSEAATCTDAANKMAMRYLENQLTTITDPYQMSIVAYALQVATSKQSGDAFRRLRAMQRIDNNIYWSAIPIPTNPTFILTGLPYLYPRELIPTEGKAVEATSYALMTYLENSLLYDNDVPSIVAFIQSIRTSTAGFAGLRDSMVAQKALAKYGKLLANRALYNLQLLVSATATQGSAQTLRLNKSNWIQTQKFEVPPAHLFGQVRPLVQGTGYMLMQLETQVNVEFPYRQAPVPQANFYDVYIPANGLQFVGRNFSIMDSTVCVVWKRPNLPNVLLPETIGLTVLEVHIPTGFQNPTKNMREYTQSHVVPNLQRSETVGRQQNFYFDSLKVNVPVCVNVYAERWFPAANMTIQQKLYVYNLEEPSMFGQAIYTSVSLFSLDICQVCGSFQCPYCPYYNTASLQTVSLSMTIGCFVLYQILKQLGSTTRH